MADRYPSVMYRVSVKSFTYKSEGERHRRAEYISLVFPKFSLEYGFAQGADPFWNKNKGETTSAADL